MSIKVNMPGIVFKKYAGGREVVEVNGNTVGECPLPALFAIDPL